MSNQVEGLPERPIIIVGGGLAGLSAAHEAYLRGANVVLLDKQNFLSGNSGKATSGINGALTRTQIDIGIKDSVQEFYDDTLKAAKDRAHPDLIRVLTYQSADAVHWLGDVFGLDLSVVSRLGGHSQPRTHRGKDAKFPGMAITYRLLETLENLAEGQPDRVRILKSFQAIDLLKEEGDEYVIIGVKCKDLKNKTKYDVFGPVIMATGGYAADFTKNSLLRKYRPEVIDLPSTNGTHATGDGQKIIMKNKGVGIDMEKVQVHPTGLIDMNNKDVITGKAKARFLFLGAEALRGEGGIIFNNKGERFVDELGTRDYVSGEMEKQVNAGNGPIRLVLNEQGAQKLPFHVKHYQQRNLMKKISGKELVQELGCTVEALRGQLDRYNKAAKGEIEDVAGKKYFPNTPFELSLDGEYYVSFITRVLHFTMGGVKINDKSEVIYDDDKVFQGLYACGELAGGVHGHNRLGGSSLLACVVYGRLSADQAASYVLRKLSTAKQVAEVKGQDQAPINRLKQISFHIDPTRPQRIVIDWQSDGHADKTTPGESSAESAETTQKESFNPPKDDTQNKEPPKETPKKGTEKPAKAFEIPDKEFTKEEVSKHNKREDCWCIVKNVVMDLTPFLKDHPGGEDAIVNFAGKDASESFDMLHEDNVIPRYAKSCVLGRVKGETPFLKL